MVGVYIGAICRAYIGLFYQKGNVLKGSLHKDPLFCRFLNVSIPVEGITWNPKSQTLSTKP